MTAPNTAGINWHTGERRLVTFARNVATRYLAIVLNAVIGLIVLPINLRYLGKDAYGLWALTTSITAYFTVLEFGYGGAVVRFVAEYRSRKDASALNEILSTMFFTFSAIGVLSYVVALGAAAALPHVFHLSGEQARTGQWVLLITAVNIALYFPFSVYGGLINGFERYYVNNVVGTVSNVVAAVVNVLVVTSGYGLVALVAATTTVRVLPFFVYRWNARRVFPEMRISRHLYRRERLRDLTGFSVYLAVIDWSARICYTTDTFVLGIFMNTAAVAVFSVGTRLSDSLVRMCNQLHTFLFPAVVQRAVAGAEGAQRDLLVKASRFQLAIAVALCMSVIAVADVLVRAWVGPGYEGSVLITQLLAFVVILRAWMAVPSTVLKGSGHHKYVATVSACSAVANLLLSIALVKLMGMVGVALGTVVPATILAAAFIFPRACREVGLDVWRGYRDVVWPAVWPAAISATVLVAGRGLLPVRILAVLAEIGVGALIYAVLFFLFGLGRDERQWCTSAVADLWRRRSTNRLAAA